MGRPDQAAKQILRDETPRATGHRVTVRVPPEVPVGALQPDGVVRVVLAPGLSELDAPWCRLRVEATLDVKMPGDHLDRACLARCELRRQARWVQHLEGDPAPKDPDPSEYATWVVAPHVPKWMLEDAARGALLLERVAGGCWRVGSREYETLWIAANELPLRLDLIPLLLARSGRALGEFLLWAAAKRGLDWTAKVVKDLDMTTEIASEILSSAAHDEEQHRIKTELTRRLLDAFPAAANEIREKAHEEGREEGREEGIKRGLRLAVEAICDALNIPLDADRGAWLSTASAAALEARLAELRAQRAWR